ncbi:hypothetical protein IC582_028788 [Cucumis melo]
MYLSIGWDLAFSHYYNISYYQWTFLSKEQNTLEGFCLSPLFGLSDFRRHVELPPWADIVKAAGFKELAPYDAVGTTSSMARKIYSRGGLGVGALKQIYGGSKRNDTKILDQVAGQIVVIDQLPLFLN